MKLLLLLFFIGIFIIIHFNRKETFARSDCPTRNMSFDLRGEAYFPPRTNFPFDNSVIGPSNEKCYPKNNLV